MAKRIIAFILAVATVALCFTACTGGGDEPETNSAIIEQETVIREDNSTFKLSYTQADSLDPYESKTLNNQILSQLVFESLFDLDENFKASLNIASSYEYEDSETLSVGVTAGLTFTDGSTLTAQDVADSFRAAKDSDYWGSSLQGIDSCSVRSDTEIVFNLRAPNPYAHNLLVFPIVSSDGSGDFPIGSGRYYYADENGETVLKANTQNGFQPHITVIHLENIASEDSIDNAVNIGNISFAFRDLSSNSSRRITANKRLINMNNLVFIGVNNKSGITANADVRRAISLAIDRTTLARSAYGGFAQAATGVFNPQFELSETQLFSEEGDSAAAGQLLQTSGVSTRDISIVVNASNTDRVTCAKLIEQQLEEAGFNVTVYEESDERYFERIANEQFNLYIGEIKLPPDMSMRAFFDEDGTARYGIDTANSQSAAAYAAYSDSAGQIGDFLLAFSAEMPFIPVVYRRGMICFTKAMNGDVQGSYYDCFSNIEDWYFEAD